MQTVCTLNKCNGCMACKAICPKQCIDIKDSYSSYNAVIDKEKCINCLKCINVCPNNKHVLFYTPIKWYQGWNCSSERKISSSGGIAYALMKSFIESGGYVSACLFKNNEFYFDITNDLQYIRNYVGSKYVKSNPYEIYKKISEILKKNKVLFIGLPCQVAALKNYTNDHESLFTVDLICHGTPSPKILNNYLEENNYNINNIENIEFRKKSIFGLIIDSNRIALNGMVDDYIYSFLQSLTYTENCYECQFAQQKRVSDITIGDSWGTEYAEEKKNGISIMLVQTKKGDMILKNSDITLKNVNADNAVKFNHQLSYPAIKTKNVDSFFKSFLKYKSFKKALFAACPFSVIKRKIKYILLRSRNRK